jgi:DNA-binding LytR/AlgR family response regulator
MKHTLLAVDDESDILDWYRSTLSVPKVDDALSALDQLWEQESTDDVDSSNAVGYELLTASQGEDAYVLMKNLYAEGGNISVAFIDMRMPPGWNGMKTSLQLRSIDPDLYIVIVTAYSDYSAEEIQDVLEHDVLLLKKPVKAEELKQVAHNFCMAREGDDDLKESNLQLKEEVQTDQDTLDCLSNLLNESDKD